MGDGEAGGPHRITRNTDRAQCVYTADLCNTVAAEHSPHEITVPIKPDILAALTRAAPWPDRAGCCRVLTPFSADGEASW